MAVSRIQDRTVEFRTVVQQAQRRHAQSAKGGASAQKKRAMMFAGSGASIPQQQQQPLLAPPGAYNDGALDDQGGAAAAAAHVRRSEFARRAAEIGRGISATMAKLERLAMREWEEGDLGRREAGGCARETTALDDVMLMLTICGQWRNGRACLTTRRQR